MAGFCLIRRVQPRPSLLPLGPFCVASGGVASSPNTEDKDRGTRGGVFREVEVMATLRRRPDRKSKSTVLTPIPSSNQLRGAPLPPSHPPSGRRTWTPLSPSSTSIQQHELTPRRHRRTGQGATVREFPPAGPPFPLRRRPQGAPPPPLGPPIGYGTYSAVRRVVIFFLNHRTDRCSLSHFFVLVNGFAKTPHKQQPQDTIFGKKFWMFSLIPCMHPCPTVQRKPFSRSAIRACQPRAWSMSTHSLHDSRKHGRLAARRLSE